MLEKIKGNKKAKWALMILILVALSAGGYFFFSLVLTPLILTPDSEYFPLGINTSWEYNSTDDNDSWKTRRYIEDDYEYLGTHFTVYFSEEREGKWENTMWLEKTHNSLVWWGFEDENAKVIAFNGITYVVEPPVKGDVQGGETLTVLTVHGDESSTLFPMFKGEYTIDKIETVEVPAGKFEDCIKVHETEETPDGKADFYVWYAPDVGPIKYDYPKRDNRVDILTEYDIVENDDPFEDWFLPKVPYLIITCLIGVISAIVIFIVLKKRQKSKQ